jgi:hypothetical protein
MTVVFHVMLFYCFDFVSTLYQLSVALLLYTKSTILMHPKYIHDLCSLLMHIPTYYNKISCYNHDL